MISYNYVLAGFHKTGQKIIIKFTAYKDRPVIQGTYLEITWNQRRGVTSYEQVKESNVPSKAKEKLLGGNKYGKHCRSSKR